MRDGYVRRIAENALGALVSAVGIAMMLQANVGLEPWSVLQEGMSNTMGITYGTASILVGAVIIAVSLLCGGAHRPGHGAQHRAVRGIYRPASRPWGGIPQMDTLWGGLLMLAARAGDPGHRHLALYAHRPGCRPQGLADGGPWPARPAGRWASAGPRWRSP